MRRRAAVAAFIAIWLAACARSTPSPDSGVTGQVLVGPMCPVVQPGVACPDQPLAADLEVVDRSGHRIARTRSQEDGAYRIPLEAGAYTLKPLPPGQAGPPFASPIPFEVAAGAWTPLDVHYDSGIR